MYRCVQADPTGAAEWLPEGICGVQDVHLIRDALAQRGYEEALLDDIFYYNLLRVLPVQA